MTDNILSEIRSTFFNQSLRRPMSTSKFGHSTGFESTMPREDKSTSKISQLESKLEKMKERENQRFNSFQDSIFQEKEKATGGLQEELLEQILKREKSFLALAERLPTEFRAMKDQNAKMLESISIKSAHMKKNIKEEASKASGDPSFKQWVSVEVNKTKKSIQEVEEGLIKVLSDGKEDAVTRLGLINERVEFELSSEGEKADKLVKITTEVFIELRKEVAEERDQRKVCEKKLTRLLETAVEKINAFL